MPVQLSHVRTRPKTVHVDVEGEQLTVTYNAAAVTPDLEKDLRSRGTEGLARFLNEAIQEWDLFDGKDVLPTDEAILNGLPLAFLESVVSAIVGDLVPNQTSGTTSSAG